MNAAQRTVIVFGVFVVMLMGLVPPWTERLEYPTGGETARVARPIGYAPIFAPPAAASSGENESLRPFYYTAIDVTRLGVQVGVVIVVTVGAVLAAQGRPKTPTLGAEREV